MGGVISLPSLLRPLPQWVGWRLESRDGKPTKVPINPRTGQRAATDQPASWGSLEDAQAAVGRYQLSGIGFVFEAGGGLVGVDLDKCRDTTSGQIEPWAQEIVRELDSYTELSPSGTGLHVLLSGELPAGSRRKGHVEMYDRGRYFTVTGDHLAGTPAEIQVREAELWAVHAKVFGPILSTERAPASTRSSAIHSDAEIIRRASDARNGAKFARLWAGNWQGEYLTQSEADSALCAMLAFWTGNDSARMDALFRQSGLFREKWNEKHYADGRTYGEGTIDHAVRIPRNTFSGIAKRTTSVDEPCLPESISQSGQTRFPLTDAGNAEHFASKYSDIVRFDHRRGRWLLWRTHRWCPDVDEEIRRLSKLSSRDRFRSAAVCEDLKERERIAKWAIQSESRSKLDAFLALAKAETPIADGGDNWDRDPFLLGTPNGVVELRTGELRPGRQDDRLTMSTDVPFDPTATCPRWERFIAEVFGDDDELIGFVRRAIGYSLTGTTEEQCLFLCYGSGANGKSTLVGTLTSLLGDYGWNMPFSTIEQHQRASIPNDMAALVGRRFVVASETNDGTRINEARVKALTGCDPITARFLHAEFFTFRPVAKVWLSVNHKPVVSDDSHGFWRRIRLIPFQRTFPVNPALAMELHAERSGILGWAVRGCLEWQQHGLQPPRIVSDATKEYACDSDPLAEFIAEFCLLGAESRVGAAELYSHYHAWTRRHEMTDRERLTRTMFGRKMSERFKRENARSGRVYLGIERRAM